MEWVVGIQLDVDSHIVYVSKENVLKTYRAQLAVLDLPPHA